jgi:hypothetical protein
MLMCAELLSFTCTCSNLSIEFNAGHPVLSAASTDHLHADEYAQDYTVDSARPIDEPDLALLRDASIRLNGWHHRWMGWANNVPDRPG